uniref:Uncharacterized protein n=1 Tax=Rhizophora mucronata TaxID=61149 RepID=A0A2P2IU52_RHIMU
MLFISCSQLLPHVAYIVRHVKELFRRCKLPDLRKKLYSAMKMLLISMGIGSCQQFVS